MSLLFFILHANIAEANSTNNFSSSISYLFDRQQSLRDNVISYDIEDSLSLPTPAGGENVKVQVVSQNKNLSANIDKVTNVMKNVSTSESVTSCNIGLIRYYFVDKKTYTMYNTPETNSNLGWDYHVFLCQDCSNDNTKELEVLYSNIVENACKNNTLKPAPETSPF